MGQGSHEENQKNQRKKNNNKIESEKIQILLRMDFVRTVCLTVLSFGFLRFLRVTALTVLKLTEINLPRPAECFYFYCHLFLNA